eukprot:359550-Prymnesium_polylepis.2
MASSRFWSAMEQDGVIATGFDSTRLTHSQRHFSRFEVFLQSLAWGRGRTLSMSYASARVPQAFCAQPMFHHAGCGTFDLLLAFRMSRRIWALLTRISLTDRCGADISEVTNTPECSLLQERACAPLNRSIYESMLVDFRKPYGKESHACNSRPPGLCEVGTNTSWDGHGVQRLEAAMLALQERTLCLLEPWTTHLNSEIQLKSSLIVASALKEALVAVAYTWANAQQRGFDAAKAHKRRRSRALNFSLQLEESFGIPRPEVWGLALNV